jgi:hypothetical protein
MVARNAACPCGSGRKYKLCCGTTRAEEQDLARRVAVVAEVAALALNFPRLRAGGAGFSAWADSVAAGELDDTAIEDGLRLLEPEERARIESAHAEEFPTVWRSLCADLGGDEELARHAVVAGAVLAAVRERQPPDPRVLTLLEESDDLGHDACETLAFALEPGDLWSVYETLQLEEALLEIPEELDDDAYEVVWDSVMRAQAARLRTRWHDHRLKLLVSRLRAQLPLAEHPQASSALMAACEAFERDLSVRRRLATLLLADSLAVMHTDLPLAA